MVGVERGRVVFAASLVVLVGGLLAAGRLPERVPAQAS